MIDRAGRRRERRHERWWLVGLTAVLVLVTFGNKWGAFAPDTKPDLYYAPGRFLAGTLSAWLPALGQAGRGNFNTGMAPVAVVIYLLRGLGLSPWVTVRVWRLGLYFLAGWGIRRYFHDLMGGHTNRWARMAVMVLYLANAFVITQGNTTPELLPYALLPWLLLAQRRSIGEPRSWVRAGEFALVFFAMTGMNAGVVPLFLMLAFPCQLIASRMVDRVSWPDLWRSLWRCGFLCFGVSIYWLLPTAQASSTGVGVASATESPSAVAQTTSYGEVGRLLGHWPTYGRFGTRLYEPSYVSYITSPWVLTATFLVLVFAAFSAWWASGQRRRVRVTAGLLIAIAVPVEVGMFPPDKMPLVGQFINKMFAKVPATLAFRTTSKIGPLVLLAIVLCVGLGAMEASHRAPHWRRAYRGVGALVVFAVVAGSTYPAWSGNLYDSAWRVPGYWKQLSADVDAKPSESRVLVVPGGNGGNYRWGMRSPDDVFPSIMKRTVVSHNTVAGEGEYAANLMAGVDGPLNEGTLTPGALSVLGRYLGTDQVILRNDTRYEELTGGDPLTIQSQVDADPGLGKPTTYGKPGENLRRPDVPLDQQRDVLKLHPALRYPLKNPTPTIRAESAKGLLVLAGDGFAVPQLVANGLLDGSRPFRYTSELDKASLTQAVNDGLGVALTDTNRRRTWSINRLADAFSNTLSVADDPRAGDGPTLTLHVDRPDTQTVNYIEGVANITASKLDFGVHPYGKPQNAFDFDSNTKWNAGPFGTAKGKHITVTFNKPRKVSQVSVRLDLSGPSRISGIMVEAGGQQQLAQFAPTTPLVTVTFPNVTAKSVTVTVTSVSPGLNQVGISSIDIPGVVANEVSRLPTDFNRLYAQLDPLTKVKLASMPMDVLFQRQAGQADDPESDEEKVVNRDFELPQARSFNFTVGIRRLSDLPSDVLNDWLPAGTGPEQCEQVATLDNKPLFVRPTVRVTRADLKNPVTLVPCDGRPMQLRPGLHRYRGSRSWTIATVRFSSVTPAKLAVGKPPTVSVVAIDDTHARLAVGAATSPYYLITGQAYDSRWEAYLDGKSLGVPVLIDGYSVGWRVPAGGPHRIDIAFGPQSSVSLSFALSGLFLAGILAMMIWPALPHRRRRATRPGRRARGANGGPDAAPDAPDAGHGAPDPTVAPS